MAEVYNFQYSPINVYGHVVAMLGEQVVVREGAIHLDIGCGYGPFAEKLAEAGFTYVGVDGATDGLASLASRGFETHRANLSDLAASLATLNQIVAGREISSITCLDMLEHVHDPRAVLTAFRKLVGDRTTPLVTSVPNVSHFDVAAKLLFGHFDHTDVGILDRTHVTHFTNRVYLSLLMETGWQPIAADDVEFFECDQHFPRDHLALADGSLLQSYLRRIRAEADPFARTNQLVRLSLPSLPKSLPYEPASRPDLFLSVIVVSDGTNSDGLRDLIWCLAAQIDREFEVLIAGHSLTVDRQIEIERAIEDADDGLRHRLRLIVQQTNHPIEALDGVLSEAKGRYLVVVKETTVLMRGWVATFRALEHGRPGAVLRAASGRHALPSTLGLDPFGAALLDSSTALGPLNFDLATHLVEDATPPSAYAFPRALVRDLGRKFDVLLPTLAHWDFLVRAALICGVASSTEVTSIVGDATVLSENSEAAKVRAGFDQIELLLAAGSATRLAELVRAARAAPMSKCTRTETYSSDTFLSLLVASDGRPPQRLNELMTCLLAQTDADFEVIVLGYDLDETRREIVAAACGTSEVLRMKCRFVPCETASQIAALNNGLEMVAGRYVAVVEPAAFLAPDWIAAFRTLQREGDGTVLKVAFHDRSTPAPGIVLTNSIGQHANVMRKPDLEFYSALMRAVPPTCISVFPATLVHENGWKFDIALPTLFHWDFFIRAGLARGVSASPRSTCSIEQQRAELGAIERNWLRARIDSLLPPECVERLQAIVLENVELRSAYSQTVAERDALHNWTQSLQSQSSELESVVRQKDELIAQLYAELSNPPGFTQ